MSAPEATSALRSKFGEKRRLRSVRDRCRTRILDEKVDLWKLLEAQARRSAAHATSSVRKLPAEEFLQVLAQNGLRLQDQDANLVVSKFADFRGFINYDKFYRMLDVLPPDDHVDPALARDRLPQPYRMLVKILEDDVLEAAWEQISLRNLPNSGRTSQSQSVLEGSSAGDPASSSSSDAHANSRAIAGEASAAASEQSRRAMNQTEVAVQQQLETLRLMKSKPRTMRHCQPSARVALGGTRAHASSQNHRYTCLGTDDGRVVVIGEENKLLAMEVQAFSGPVVALACAEFGMASLVAIAFHRPRRTREDDGVIEDGQGENAQDRETSDEVEPASGPTFAQILVLDPLQGVLECVGETVELEATVESAWIEASAWTEKRTLRCACATFEPPASDGNVPEPDPSETDEAPRAAQRTLVHFDVSYEAPNFDNVPMLEGAHETDETEPQTGEEKHAPDETVAWARARPDAALPSAAGPVRGFFCKSRPFFTAYVRGCNEVHEHRWSSARTRVTWMSSGILCDAQHVTANGVELCAFGLEDGCITVWNVWASVVRAILRHHQTSTTSATFMTSNGDVDSGGSETSGSSVQILAGCGDGKLRLFQLSSDAPSSAAIRPRGGASATLADEDFAAALTGGNFLTAFEDAAALGGEAGATNTSAAVLSLRRVPGTPLLTASTQSEVRLYDMEAGAQVGALDAAAAEPAGDSLDREAFAPVAAFADQDIAVLGRQDEIAVFPAYLYMTSCYPSIARALKFVDPAQPRTTAMKRRLAIDAVKLLNGTTAEQRCNPDRDLAGVGINQQASMVGLASLTSLSAEPSTRISGAGPTSNAMVLGSAGLQQAQQQHANHQQQQASAAFTFSNVGFLASKLRARKMQASKNVINPTRLNESLVRTLPRDKLSEFEERRVETRAEREAHLSASLARWGSISHVAR